MSFTIEYLPVERYRHFSFFATSTSSMDESFAPGFDFELAEIRLHLSTVHVSVIDIIARVSHHLGSMYDNLILSVAMLGVQDYIYTPFPSQMIWHYQDTINISMVMSDTNTFGLEVNGWAVTQTD